LLPASRNAMSLRFDCELTEDGMLQGTMTWKNLGMFNALFRSAFKSASPEKRADGVQGFMATFVSGALKISDIKFSDLDDQSSPVTLTLRFQCEGSTTEVGDMLMVKLPEFLFLDKELAQMTVMKERKCLVNTDLAFSRSTEIVVRLPAGHQVPSLPKGVKLESKVGRYVSSYEADGGVVKMRRELAIETDRVATADYPQLQELVAMKTKELRKQLVLKKD
jgi:hypothetical protein